MTTTPRFDATNPEWLAHRYDATTGDIWFRYLPRAQHAGGPFLTDDLVGDAPEYRMSRSTAVAAVSEHSAPVHFIFHSAFCTSTLFTRAFDQPGLAMGLSEPVILNDIVGIRRRGELAPRDIAHLMDDALTLLSRRWGEDRAVVIKPSNILNAMAPLMLALKPNSRAIALYTPLPKFLASVARKGLECRIWSRTLLEGMLRDGSVQLGFETNDYFRLTDLQVAAVGWIAQHAMFHQWVASQGEGRVLMLDNEQILAARDTAMPHIAQHFGLGLSDGEQHLLINAPAFNRHSKSGSDFSSAARSSELAQARSAYQEEIDMVETWARAVAANAGVAID